MPRLLLFVVVVGALSVAAAWLADHPGELSLHWQGWEVRGTVGVLVAIVVALVALVALLQRLWLWLGAGPRRFLAGRRSDRRERGYRDLGHGLVAVAAGDGAAARRLARSASAELGDAPLALLLEAQAAQLAGDETAAKERYQRMLATPETEFLALRSLAAQALKSGDVGEALSHARRARTLKPDAPWALLTVADLASRAGHWSETAAALADAVKHKALPRGDSDRRRAAARLAEAKADRAAGRLAEAEAHAREAHKLAPALAPAAAFLAEILAAAGKAAAAARVIEESWREAPHGILADAYVAALADPLERLRRLERLATTQSDHPEARLAVAAAAVAAGLWGEARRQLAPLVTAAGSVRAFRLMATIEDGEKGDGAAARDWLLRATTAPPDPAWTCHACGTVSPAWEACCHACGTLDGLRWQQPRGSVLALDDGKDRKAP